MGQGHGGIPASLSWGDFETYAHAEGDETGTQQELSHTDERLLMDNKREGRHGEGAVELMKRRWRRISKGVA
eukprot:4681464-Pyramimonas_sp.AAC.1